MHSREPKTNGQLSSTWTRILQTVALLLVAGSVTAMWGQCVAHPRGRTAVRFSNQSRHELAFFLDDSDEIVLASKTMTPPLEVEPGEHMLRARAMIKGQAVWVWTINEVPRGQTCTWSVHDPEPGSWKTSLLEPRRSQHKADIAGN